jgi:hypothetical protein
LQHVFNALRAVIGVPWRAEVDHVENHSIYNTRHA